MDEAIIQELAWARLLSALTAAGLPVTGTAHHVKPPDTTTGGTYHRHPLGDVICICWRDRPTARQLAAAETIVQAFDPTPCVLDRITPSEACALMASGLGQFSEVEQEQIKTLAATLVKKAKGI